MYARLILSNDLFDFRENIIKENTTEWNAITVHVS